MGTLDYFNRKPALLTSYTGSTTTYEYTDPITVTVSSPSSIVVSLPDPDTITIEIEGD